ncbi:hypothetical protein EDC94DRAFT_599040, partial [Helicostylum pulchrum]
MCMCCGLFFFVVFFLWSFFFCGLLSLLSFILASLFFRWWKLSGAFVTIYLLVLCLLLVYF